MKKFILIMVCIVAITIDARSQINTFKVKEKAFNAFKLTLIAPSQFILTDEYGNKISINKIKTTLEKKVIKCDTICYSDSTAEVVKKIFQPVYNVFIIGDGRNRMGGYEQLREIVYVDFKYNTHNKRPYEEYKIKTTMRELGIVNKNNVALLPPPTRPNEGKIFDVVEQQPTFKEGDVRAWIERNIQYPSVAYENGISGRVVVGFVIECDGSLSQIKVLRGIDPLLDKEAIRVIESMPKWNPGIQNGSPVRVRYNLPIQFKINN